MRLPVIACVLSLAGCAPSNQEQRSNPPASSGSAQPSLDSTAVDVGMERVRPVVSSCLGPSRAGTTWNVHLTIRNDGHPTDVQVDGDTQDPQVAACLEGAISGATFAPFTGPPVKIDYPFYIH